jgi:uroporphyrinogen-III decarboxylase
MLDAEGIWIEECLTDMISPAMFAELNVPLVSELCSSIRSEGMHSIYYYCGNPNDRLDLLLSVGADALALEEGKKGFSINIEDIVDKVQGRCTLLGNLDAIHLLEHGSEAELRAEIARQIGAGRRNGSRFIMSIGSPVTPGTSVERVWLYCDLVHELGGRT